MNKDDANRNTSSPEYYCWAASDVGLVRTNNEDSYRTSAQRDEQAGARWEGPLGPSAWALVADGMGGHAAGEVASALAVECLGAILPNLEGEDGIGLAVEATNQAIHDATRLRPDLSGMGTTIAGISVRGKSAFLFNVGDSRIYVSDTVGKLKRLSEDHVVSGYMLTKCLGGTRSLSVVEPYVRRIELVSGSRVMLCTDGLTDELHDEQIGGLLRTSDPAERLLQAALSNGGRDNVTVVVLELR